MAVPSFETMHEDLTALQQFCIRAGKQPYIHDGDRKNSFTSSGWPEHRKDWLTFSEAVDALQRGVKVYHDGTFQPVDGIGFLITRSGHDAKRPLGGDIDCCRNPITGLISPWAAAFLQSIQPFHTEISPSRCGLRFFVWGHLPNERDNMFGSGSQDDLTEDDREAILVAKPKAREKLAKGEKAFNGLEIYEANRHLTITGQKLAEYCFPSVDRTEAISQALEPFIVAETVGKVAEEVKQSGRGKLPHLSVLNVIDTTGFSDSGGQLFGSHPTLGSTTGKNLVVDPKADVWAYMHNKPSKGAPGGDAWIWLACECGAVRWEDAGKGVLRDREVVEKTLKHAIARELIEEEQAKYEIPPLERGEALLLVEDLKAKAKDDAGIAFEPKYIEALAFIYNSDLAEYERALAELKGKASIRDLKKSISKKVSEMAQRVEEAKKEGKWVVPKDIKQAAKDVIKCGNAYEYIYQIWQKRVKGNQWLGRSLLISRGVQSCLNTNGLHDYAHGKHGQGKSKGMEAMAELVPPEYMMDEDVSPLAVYYASEEGFLLPGTTLFIDEMIWNDALGGMCKRITTRFQNGAAHLTVIDGRPRKFKTKERIAIWTNSADMQADEQLRDRFFDSPVDENQTKDIIEFQKIRDTLPGAPEDVARETAICQEILRDLANKTFTVKIPFSQRIRFPTAEGTRGYNIFSDLIKGLAAMRYAKRERDDKGQLLATEDDFNDAKKVYEGNKGHSEERYGTAEAKVLQAIIDNGHKALVKDIKRLTGLSEGRIKDIMNGRGKDEQKRHGLLYKCSQLEADRVDISTVVSTDDRGYAIDRRTIHPLEYSLPDTFRLHNGEGELIFLDPDVSDVDADVPKDVPKINNSKNTDVLDVDKSKREDNLILPPIDEKEVSKLNISLIEQKCYVNTSGCQQIVKPSEMGAISTTSDTSASSLDREKALRRDAPTVGPNPRKDAPTPSKLKEDVAEKHTKEVLSYSDMVQFVPYDTSSPEAEQICTSIRGQLAKGTAPRIDFVRIDTKLSREIVELYMDNAAWLRKDDSAQSGIVVYLPVEPSDVP